MHNSLLTKLGLSLRLFWPQRYRVSVMRCSLCNYRLLPMPPQLHLGKQTQGCCPHIWAYGRECSCPKGCAELPLVEVSVPAGERQR